MNSSAPSSSVDPKGRGFGLLSTLPLAGLLLLASVLGAEGFAWSPQDLVLVGVIDLLLLSALHEGARWLRALHPILGGFGSLSVGLLVALSLWLDTDWLSRRLYILLCVGLVVAVHQALLVKQCPRGEQGRKAAISFFRGIACLMLTAGAVALVANSQPSAHWHLMKHQRVIGLSLYKLKSAAINRSSMEWEEAQLRRGVGGLVDPRGVAAGLSPPRVLEGGDLEHVVFVLVDTWRADSLAAYAGDPDLMPRLNALAEDGVVLTNMHANASWTRASCATIFTGLLPEEAGAASFHDELPEAWTTLPEVFQAAGYGTAAFVTNWIQVGIETGFGQGFDTFDELRSAEEVQVRIESEGAHIREQYARAEEVNHDVFAWLDGDEAPPHAEQPLFLYLHYLDPHSPYMAGVEEGVAPNMRARKRSAYRNEVRYTDEHLAELVGGLRQRLGEDISIVITSDHGEEFWEHGAWGHGHSLYREQVWVPAIVLQGEAPDSSGSQGSIDAALELRDLFDLSLALGLPGTLNVAAWATEHARPTRYASQYLEQSQHAPFPDQRKTVMRRLDEGLDTMIWSAFGPTTEVYLGAENANELNNRAGADPARDASMQEMMDSAVGFWARSSKVLRTAAELQFLSDLGYGGADAALPDKSEQDESSGGQE